MSEAEKYFDFFTEQLKSAGVSVIDINEVTYASYADIYSMILKSDEKNLGNISKFKTRIDGDNGNIKFIEYENGKIFTRRSPSRKKYYIEINKALVLICANVLSDKAQSLVDELLSYYYENTYPENVNKHNEFIDMRNNILIVNNKNIHTFNEYGVDGKIKNVWIHFGSLTKSLGYIKSHEKIKIDHFKDCSDDYFISYEEIITSDSFRTRKFEESIQRSILENLTSRAVHSEYCITSKFINIDGMFKLVSESRLFLSETCNKWMKRILLNNFISDANLSNDDVNINSWYMPTQKEIDHIIAKKSIGVYILKINDDNIYKYGITNRCGGVGERLEEHANIFKRGDDSFELIFFMEHTLNYQIEKTFKSFLKDKGISRNFVINSRNQHRIRYTEIFSETDEHPLDNIIDHLLYIARLISPESYKMVCDMRKERDELLEANEKLEAIVRERDETIKLLLKKVEQMS